MRDVTDNRTAELLAGVRPGRGRPRKENALSNAERQAAYRARRKASVTVTENAGVFRGERLHQDVGGLEDAMAELRAELDATKAELAEAHETIDEMNGYVNARDRENDHLVEVHDDLVRHRVELAAAHKRIELAEAERSKAFAENDKLRAELVATRKADSVPAKAYAQLQLDVVALRTENEYLEGRLAALAKGAGKSVTGNGNAVVLDLVVQLLEFACKRKTQDGRRALYSSEIWNALRNQELDKAVYERLIDVVCGSDKQLEAKIVAAEKKLRGKSVTKKTV